MIKALFVVASVALVSVFGRAAADATPIIHPGDTLSVVVNNYSALIDDSQGRLKELQTDSVVVAADGSISIPVAGTINVAGKSTSQIESSIESKLNPYIKDPSVTVRLMLQSQFLFLTGATVGTLPYLPGETLSTALSQLREQLEKDLAPVQNSDDKNGRTVSRSGIDLRRVALKRDGQVSQNVDGEQLLRNGQPGPELEPGDTLLFVNKPIRVTVRGQVVAPGPIYLYSDDTLEQAVLDAGGPLGSASTVDASLIRNGGETPIPLGGSAIRQAPQNDDIVVVRAAPHVTVLGQVNTPGELTLKNGSTLLSSLYLAGGPTRWANVKDVEIIHAGSRSSYDLTGLTHGDLSNNVPLSDGDVVYVPEGHKIDTRLFFQGLLGAVGSFYDVTHL